MLDVIRKRLFTISLAKTLMTAQRNQTNKFQGFVRFIYKLMRFFTRYEDDIALLNGMFLSLGNKDAMPFFDKDFMFPRMCVI